MEPQRGWQFPASSGPHTSQPAERLRQQWSLSNGGAINLSGLLETRSEEIGHGSASMSLILRRDGNTGGGQGRTVVLSPSVGSEGSRQSPAAEHRARKEHFGVGMPPERPSSSHQLLSEHANGHSQRPTMAAYRDSSLWPQRHLARTDWDAMWQRGGSVPLDAFGQPQPGRLSAMQQQKDAQRAGTSQQLPTSFPMSSDLQERPQSRSALLPSSAPLEQRTQSQAERPEGVAQQLPSSSAGHRPEFSGFPHAAEAPEGGVAQRQPNLGFSLQNQQAHGMQQALPPARLPQSSMGHSPAQQTHASHPEFHAFQSGQQHLRRPLSSSGGAPQRVSTPQQQAASYSQWQPSAGGRGTPDPPPAGAGYPVGTSHPQQAENGQWQPRAGVANHQGQQHGRAAFPGISAGLGDASYIQRLGESPQQWQRSVQMSHQHQSLQRQQLLQAQLRLRAESQASAAMEQQQQQQQQQHPAMGLPQPSDISSRSPQLPSVPQPGNYQGQRDSAPHSRAQDQHAQPRSGPSDSRLALQAAVLSKRMGQEPVPMPAERGSGKLPEVTLFLRQLRQHWESQGSDVAANKWTHPSLLWDRGQSYPLDLAALYQAVAERGGYEKVTRRKWWRSLGCDCLGADPERNRLNNEVKLAFETYLKSFADRYFDAGKVPEAESDRLGRESANKFPTNNPAGKRLDVPASRVQPSSAPGNHLQASTALGMQSGGQLHQGSTVLQWSDGSAVQTGQLTFRTALPHPHQQMGLSAPKRPVSFSADPAASKRQRLQEEQRQQAHALATPLERSPGNAQSEAVSSRIDLSAGPVFTTPAEFSERQLLDLVRAPESGVDSNVAYALNALSLASFSGPEALLPAQRQLLPALIGIVRSGLPEAFREAESSDLVEEPEEPDFSRPPTAVQRSKWAPKGHWWERAGIFSDQGLQDERLTAALCAGNVLRNLASVKSAEPFQASAAFHELLVAALKARAEEGWPALNEMVSSLLDALQPAAAAADLPALGETGAELLAQLGQLALWGSGPCRLRASAVSTAVSLAGNGANHGTIAAFTGDGGAGFLDSMAALLLLSQAEAADAARAEAHGCMGPTYELLDHQDLSQKDLQQLGLVLKFEVAATVGQALYILLHQPGEGGNAIRRQVGSHHSIAAALRHFLTGMHPPVEVPATAAGTRPPLAEASLLLRLPAELQEHATHLRMRAVDSAARCLNAIRQLPEASVNCQAFEPELALAGMSPGPAADYLAVLVGPPAAPRAAARH